MKKGVLCFFCGKMGAGKTTASRAMAQERNAVLLSEDEWLESLYPKQISSLADYVTYSNRIKTQIKPLVQSILAAGTDVVMDFPANTLEQRDWFRGIYSEIDAPHELIYLDVSNETCLAQIEQRRIDQPERHKTDTVEIFEQVTKYFVEPVPGEGFNMNTVGRGESRTLTEYLQSRYI